MDGPSMEQLMLLGSIMQSEEEGKPELPVYLTAVECRALATLSNGRFQQLFHSDDEDAGRMAKIYLHITSKLIISMLAHSMGVGERKKDGGPDGSGSGDAGSPVSDGRGADTD